jgi:hypothetical protein
MLSELARDMSSGRLFDDSDESSVSMITEQ